MNLTETDIVRPDDERPARRDGTCFYCSQPMGEKHKPDCVCVQKTVVITATVKVVVSVPRDWTEEEIDFKYNESGWCADNLVGALDAWVEKAGEKEEGAGCACGAIAIVFERDATQEDHDTLPVLE